MPRDANAQRGINCEGIKFQGQETKEIKPKGLTTCTQESGCVLSTLDKLG